MKKVFTINGILVFMVALLGLVSKTEGQVLWTSAAGSAWLTGSNWGGSVPTSSQIAQFGANPTAATGVGINFNSTTNAGTQTTGNRIEEAGAVEIASARAAAILIGNSSTTVGAAGQLRLLGTTVNGINNTIIRNASTQSFTIQNIQGSGNQTMGFILGNPTDNVVNVDNTGNVVVSSAITGNKLTLNANSSGDLRISGANTFSGGISVNGSTLGGRLRIDATNSLPTTGNIAINTGGRITFNIAGTYGTSGQSITLNPNQTTNPSIDILSGGAIVWPGSLIINADSRIEANGAAGSITFSGNASGSGGLIKQAAGNLILSGTGNTLTGNTFLGNGTLTVNSGSSMGSGSLTLFQTSTNNTAVTLNNTAQTIGNLSSQFTAVTGTQTQIITLNGTALTINQTANTTYGTGSVSTLTSTITGTGSIVKQGSAVLTLTSPSNYSGNTTISAGELRFNPSANSTLSGSVNLSGGTLGTNGITASRTLSFGTLNLTDNSFIDLSSTNAHTITFSASDAITWTSAKTIIITGWQGSFNGTPGTTGRIFVGSSNTGLTVGQLAQITFKDGSNVSYPATILGNGEIVPAGVACTAPSLTSVLSNNSPICANGTLNLNAVATGTAPLSYAWSGNGSFSVNNSSSASSTTVSSATSGTYTVTVTNACGTTTGNVVVVVNALPTVTASNVSGCAGSAIALIGSPLGGNFSISNPYTGSSTTYTYSYTDGNGCSATSSSASVTVNPVVTPTVSISASPSNTICSGTMVNINASGTNIGTSPNYKFFVDGISVQSSSSNIYSSATFVNGNVITCTLTSNALCSSSTSASSNSITINVTTSVTPSVSIISDAPSNTICSGVNVTFTANPVNGGTSPTYQWFLNAIPVGINSVSYSNNALINGDQVSCQIISNNGCASPLNATSNTITVTVNSTPSAPASITGTSAVCVGNTITLSDATSGGVWSSDATSIATVDVSGIVTGVTSGTANILYTVSNSCGSASASIAISVSGVPTVSSITGTSSVCVGNTTTLSDATSGGVWSSNVTGVASVDAFGVVTGVSGGTATISYAVSNGCGTTTVTQLVTVNPLPATPASITGTTTVCTGSTTTLADAVAGGVWSSSATVVASVDAFGVVSGVSLGTATITYTISNGCGSNPVSTLVTVNQTPTVVVDIPSITITSGTPVTITASGATSYLWSTTAISAAITVSPTTTTTYIVTGTSNGCSATAQSVITVLTENIVVLQIGNGTETLSANGNSIFLKQYTSTGTPVNTVAIPNSGCTPLIVSGNATSEGAISRSVDKSFIILSGYVTPVGGSVGLSGSTAASINRGIGRVDAAGNFTLPTKSSTAFSGNNIRSACSDGLDNFWGAGSGTGIAYLGTGAANTVSTSVTNTRVIQAINGNLYFSSSSGAFIGINRVGTSGLPVLGPVTSTNLIAPASGSPYGFAFNPAGTVCYVADDRATVAGGIQKWTFSGSVWSLAYTLGTGVTNIGARGVVVDFSGANPIIYATSAEATFNRLIKITDTGSGSTASTLATATTNTLFRGVAFAPVNSCSSTISITPTVTNSCGPNTGSVSIAVSGGSTPYSYAWSNAAGTVCQTTQNLTGVGAGSYTVKVTDALGRCYATSTSTVTQSAAPSPVVTGTLGFCPGFSTTLDAGTSDASGSYTSYSWSSGQSSQTIGVNTAGSYTVTVSNANGCTGSATVSVVQFPTPSVSISGNLSFCAGGSTTLDAGAGFSSYSWSSGQATQTINVTAGGTYSVTVSNSNGCTSVSAPVVVSVSSGLTPVISGTLSFCTGSNTVLSTTSGYISYQWALNGTPINLATSNTYTATSQGTYTVAVSDGSCNGTSAGVLVTVNALPSVSISPSSPPAVCKGIPLSLTASGDPASYAWSPSTGLNSTTGATVSATPNNTTTFTVTATDVNGCSNSSPVTVSINQLPVVTVDFLNAVICAGSSATLTASGATSYNWAPSTYLNTTTGATVTSNSPSSTITYTVTGTDGNGCINTATSNVVVVPASPAPTVTNPPNLCLNSSASALTATPNPASASLLWYTSATGGIGSTSAPIPNTSTPGTTNYYVSQVPGSDVKIAINGFVDNRTPDLFSVLALSDIPAGTVIYFTDNGWTGTTFRGFPTTGLAGSEGLCKLVANNLIPAGTNIVSYSTSANYSWVTSGLIGAATGTANSFSQLSFSQTGDQIYAFMSNVPASPIGNIARHLFVFDITNGFESAISTNDGGVPPGLSQLDGTAITFQGFTTIIPPALTGQGTYYSLINDGQYRTSDQWYSYIKTESNYTKLVADITTGLPSTSFNVATACESPRSLITVTVNDAPFPDASSGGPICPGGDITLFSDPNFLFSSYSWTGPLLFTSTDQNPTITVAGITNGGNYVVTVFDGDGCTGSQTVNVTVSNSTVTGVITNTNCSGGNNGAIDITPTGGIAPYTFNWSNAATTEDISGLGVGNYTVTVTDAIGCIGTPTTFTIGSQNTASSITASATPPSVCPGFSSTLNVNGGASGATYAWTPTGTLNTNTGISVTATPIVNTTYQVVATELSGCTSSASVTVSIYTLPTVSISPSSATICNGGSISLTGSGASTYSWSPSLTLSATTGNPVTATPTSQTTYSVIGTDINGCTASSSAIISVTTIANPTSVTAAATGFTGAVNVTWVNPTSCFDEVLILASTAANTGIPVGDGSAYTSSLTYGTGTNLGNGYIVYKGITSPQIVTGLSNGTQYFIKIFTRKGSVWSVGTTDVTATPNIAPTLTEVILPKFMEGNTSTNATRIPCAYYLTLSGLTANATYRYINQVVNAADLATTSGAGNCIFVSTSGSFVSTSSPSLSNTGPFGTLVTNATGSYSGWFITEPTGNARFTPGADVNFRIRLNDGAGGTTAVTFLTTTSGVRVLSPGATTTQGTALRGASFATAKNFAVLYDNISGTGRPLSASFIESDGSTNSASYAAFYASVDGVAGSYGVIIPNNNSNGVRRIEQRTLIGANLLGCAATDADGIWPSGANTVSPTLGAPTTGTTSIVITNTDAPLFVAPITGSSSVCVGSTITLSDATVGGVWSSGSPLFASINLTGVVSALAAGTTVINYTLPSGCSSSLSVTVNPKPTLTATPTQIQCNGGTGSVALSAIGGTTPYTYGGSATTALSAGTYNYTVTDANSCSATASATINSAPSAIAISQLTNTPASCSNTATGALAVSVTGGTPTYTYNWNNGSVSSSISSLLPGNYTVTVTDANGCTAQATFTVGFTTTAILYYADLDNDTYGSNLDAGTLYCVAPPLTSLNNTDCNDAVFAINPGVSEVCGNGIDDNCNTLIDELCPTNVTLNLTMFIQGFYLSGNTMTPALVNTGVSTDPLMLEVDTVVVELHDALSPFNFVESDAQVLKVDGTIQLHFSAAILGGSYYIVVKHRNSMETWSKNPVTFSSITTFDFAH